MKAIIVLLMNGYYSLTHESVGESADAPKLIYYFLKLIQILTWSLLLNLTKTLKAQY